jgi:hypothetical protein
MAETDPRTVTLKRVRLSFTDSLKDMKKTSDDPNAKPKYSCNLILEKDQPEFEANKALVMGAIRAAGEREWKDPERYKIIQEDAPKRVCFRPGERFKNKEGKVYDGYAGNFGLTCGTPGGGQKRPKLLDRRKRPVEENDILDVCYGGSYADAIVSFYGTEKGSAGIFCTLEVVRSREEGERRGGGGWSGDVDEAFEDLGVADDSFDGPDADPLG